MPRGTTGGGRGPIGVALEGAPHQMILRRRALRGPRAGGGWSSRMNLD